MASLEFSRARNKLIGEYHSEVHPLWLEYQERMERAGSRHRYRLYRQFRKEIKPRLQQLFRNIAKIRRVKDG